MSSAKIENALNLSLEATTEEREKSLDLNVGYDEVQKSWQLIIRHDGSLIERYEKEPWLTFRGAGVRASFLTNNYGILEVPESLVSEVARQESIIYVEKPKRLNFQVTEGKRASCIISLQSDPIDGLFGKGVLVGVIDSGIDPNHPIFRRRDGSSKIIDYWDQNFDNNTEESHDITKATDVSGHGTAVASIIAQIAPDSDMIVVKLAFQKEGNTSFPRTTELMEALDYVINTAVKLGRPIAVNLSFGNNYGSHDGRSLLETYIDDLSNIGRNVIVVGSGNEGIGMNHSRIFLQGNSITVEFEIGQYVPSINLQIWKAYQDEMEIVITSPGRSRTGSLMEEAAAVRYMLGKTELLTFYGQPAPYSQNQEIYIEFLPLDSYIESGIWSVTFTPRRIIDGQVDLWLPGSNVIGLNTGFLLPSPETTLTIPSTASNVITVGAYDSYRNAYANFSGRGYTRFTNQIKPDLAAPGVGIETAAPGGGYVVQSGTSFAAPFVTAASALLMEWGIINKNDIYMYGEKVKASLIRGARQLPGYKGWPNPQLGWGVLCLSESIPHS